MIHICVPLLVSTHHPAPYERILELREEFLDMDLQQHRLEAELASLPGEIAEPDSSDSEGHETELD